MVACFDIGNSNIHLGLYNNGRLNKWIMTPVEDQVIGRSLSKMLGQKGITGAAVASVLPNATTEIKHYLKQRYKIEPVIISAKMKTPLKFTYKCPSTLGADRIANAAGGILRYRKNLLIISCGTATTIDVVLQGGHHLGGLITPGVDLFLRGLVENTALLKKVELHRPGKHIGKSTEECVRSGVINGSIAMIQGLIKAIRKEIRKKFLCVATGGWGKLMNKYIDEIDCYDQDLTTFGIYSIFKYNA